MVGLVAKVVIEFVMIGLFVAALMIRGLIGISGILR